MGSPRLVEELRIGSLDGPDEYIVGDVSRLAVTPGGSIFVADPQGPILRIYTPDGRFVH